MTVVKKELITINPQKASELLGKNFNNRELHPMNVQYFVDIIKCGEWQGSKANSIQIDIAGNLINGQHRLNSIVQTNAYLWKPYLRDPFDDHVLEFAINAGAETIVTFNKKDFLKAESLGLKIQTPKEFLEEMEV